MAYQAWPYVVTDVPCGHALSPDELRTYLRLSKSQMTDAEADQLVMDAQAVWELYTHLTLFNTGYLNYRDWFDCDLTLRRAPLVSVESVQYQLNGTFQTLATTVYKPLRLNQRNWGKLGLREGQRWPRHDHEGEVIRIAFTAGFGDNASDIPAPIKEALGRIAVDLYENRGDCTCTGDMLASLSTAAKALMNQWKILGV